MKTHNLKFKIYKIILVFIILASFVPLPLLAQNEATPAAISEEKVKEKIKERLEEVIDSVKGVIAEKQQGKIYGFSGKIKSIQESLLTIDTFGGEKQLKVASQAAILKSLPGKSSQNIDLKDLQADDFVIAMGTKEDENILFAKRLVITSQPTQAVKRKIITGKVTEVDDKKIIVKNNGDEHTLKISAKTKLKVAGMAKAAIEDVQINDQLTAIVILDKDEEIDETKVIFIIPGESSPMAKENEVEATPSATPNE